MSYFGPGYATTTAEQFEKERVERQRVGDMIRQISNLHQSQIIALEQWFRCLDKAPKQADDAMDRLIRAFREQQRCFEALYKINDKQRALPKS